MEIELSIPNNESEEEVFFSVKIGDLLFENDSLSAIVNWCQKNGCNEKQLESIQLLGESKINKAITLYINSEGRVIK